MKFGLILSIIGILIALCQPKITFAGAVSGLNIWFFQLLPSLLPFMILSNILLSDACQNYLFGNRNFDSMRRIRLIFTIATGFTFGLPIGAKITKDMYQKGWINLKDGQYLLNHCNLIGPSFVGSYVLSTKLNLPEYFLMTVCILYFPHLVCILLYFFKRQPDTQAKHNVYIPDNTFTTRKATPRLRNCFQILNVAIMNGFETITILGGYLILFGIFCSFIKELSVIPLELRAILLSCMEITTGIHEIASLSLAPVIKYVCAIPLLSFGGLCSVLQTQSVIAGCPFSMRRYIKVRILFSLLCFFLCLGTFFILC